MGPALFLALAGIQGTLFTLIMVPASFWATAHVFNLVVKWPGGLPIRFREPVDWEPGTRELTRVGPLSALLVGLITSAVGGLAAAIGGAMFALIRPEAPAGIWAGGRAALTLLLAPVCLGVLSGALNGVSSLAYNLLAPMWGGIGFEAAPLQQPSRGERSPTPTTEDRRPRVQAIGWWQWGLVSAIAAPIVALIALVVEVIVSGPVAWALAIPAILVALPRMVIGLPISVIAGFIGGALAALVYNLAGLITGGLEVETRG